MDDEVVQRVFHEGGRDYFQQQPSTSSSSILQSLPLHVVYVACSNLISFFILAFSIFSLIIAFVRNCLQFGLTEFGVCIFVP